MLTANHMVIYSHACTVNPRFFFFFRLSILTWLNAASWVWISWTIWAFPTYITGQTFQGKEGYQNSCQEGIVPVQIQLATKLNFSRAIMNAFFQICSTLFML